MHEVSIMPVKNFRINDSLIWLDWLVYILLGLIVAIISPLGMIANVLLTVILAILYRFTLRVIWISVFPDIYRIYTCPECSAIVSADEQICPTCNIRFDDPPKVAVYRSNVVLFSCVLTFVLTVVSMIAAPNYVYDGLVNIFVIYILSIFLVYFDARRIGAGRSESGWGKITPVWWIVLLLVLWIFTFPLYLIKRKQIFSPLPINENGNNGEFSKADVIGSLLIGITSPISGALLAIYYAGRRKYHYFVAVLFIVLISWGITMGIRGRFG